MSETTPSARTGAVLAQLQAPVAAFSFLTRLPTPRRSLPDAALAASVAWFPLVGALLGGLQLLLGRGLFALHYSGTFAAVAVVALGALLTGGLHLDGLCDVVDGLGGGRGDRERSLAIMRDSRIGAFGATALVLVIAGKIAMVQQLLGTSPAWAVVLAPVCARAACALLIVAFPYARSEGLGVVFRAGTGRVRFALALLLAASLTLGLAPALGSALVATCAVAWLCARWVALRLGGLTGDVYGAAIELSELAFLIAAFPLVGA